MTEKNSSEHKHENHKEEKITYDEVSCSFCSKKISSPKELTSLSKHTCYDCYVKLSKDTAPEKLEKMHVELPLDRPEVFSNYANVALLNAFTALWDAEKKRLKDFSKRELSQAMFAEGAQFMMEFTKNLSDWRSKHGNFMHAQVGNESS